MQCSVLGTATLDKAVTVKLTRTLAIIPITLVLGYLVGKREQDANHEVNIRSLCRALYCTSYWLR